uniref:ubiquitinyl hydrolase 1 n=1 Tax=Plectus sambesii TaxID=2011161 RepID=A0A914UGJ3_9BILA
MNNNTSRMKGALMKAYCDLLQQLWADVRSSSGSYVSPDNFKNQIQKFAPRFVGYQQQDSQEFLRYLLQGLHEDVNRVRTKPTPLPPMDDTLPDSQKAMECWKRYLRTDDSKVVDVFVGQLKSELICTHCGHTSTTFDPFWDLSLPIPNDRRSAGNINLEDCLTAFTREEVLDGDEMPKCEKCCVHRRCTKKFSVYKFPKILVLHMKRFSGERFRSRLSTLVNYPIANLDLGRFGASGCGHSLYNLYAVSNHTGTPTMGHYTAYVRHAFSGQWQLFDDSRVTPCRNVVTSEAYVLFYELATDKTVQESSR